MKRIISIICVIALLTTMLSSVVFGADFLGSYSGNDVIVNEDFSNVTGYKTNDAFGNSSFKVLSNIENASVENGALKYAPTSGAASKIFLQTDSPLSGDFIIEFKFMQPTVGAFNNLFFLSDYSTANGMRIALDGGQIRVGDYTTISPVKGYTANNWYPIKIVFSGVTNSTSGTYDVYVNNEKVVTGNNLYNYPGKTKDPVYRMIMWGTAGNATTYIDDFKVYKEVKFEEGSGITKLANEDFSGVTAVPTGTLLSNNSLKVVSAHNASVDNGRVKVDNSANKADPNNKEATFYTDIVPGSVLDGVDKFVIEFDFVADELKNIELFSTAGKTSSGGFTDAFYVKVWQGNFYYVSAGNATKQFLAATKTGQPYNMKIYVDETKGTFDVYVDGTNYVNDAPFMDSSITDITRIFRTRGTGSGISYYIDNIAIYSDKMLDAIESISLPDRTTETKINLPSSVGGFDVTWSSSNAKLIATDGTITMPAVNQNSMLTATIKAGGRMLTKTSKVIVLAPAGLKVSYANNIVKASAYYPGKLYSLTPNPVIVTAIFKDGKLFSMSHGGAREGDYYNYYVDTSLYKAGNYTAKAFVLRDLTSFEPLAEAAAPVSFTVESYEFTGEYNATSKTLTISGTGAMPEYDSFADTPWSEYAEAKTIEIGSRVASISANSLEGFANLEKVVIPDNVSDIDAAAFPNTDFEVKCNLHTAAAAYAEANDKQIKLIKLRVLSIGNSHTYDHTRWINDIRNDMYAAGLDTEVYHSILFFGGRQMYTSTHSHYYAGTNPSHGDYATYNNALTNNTWDLIIIQDWHESAQDDYADHFVEGLGNTVAWLKSKQPQAKVAWVQDWADKNMFHYTATDTLEAVYANITGAMALVENMTENKPDFIFPMGTAVQNARSSYFGTTNNAKDAYTNMSDTDWAQGNLHNYTILERDTTHCSHELARYLTGATVYGAIMQSFEDIMDTSDDFDYFASLKTAPVTTGAAEWKGEFNDNIWAIVKESAANALAKKNAVTQSAYTNDPANDIARAIENADYSSGDFAAATIAAKANTAAEGKVTIAASDVTVNGNSATIKFLYGYTEKTVTISK